MASTHAVLPEKARVTRTLAIMAGLLSAACASGGSGGSGAAPGGATTPNQIDPARVEVGHLGSDVEIVRETYSTRSTLTGEMEALWGALPEVYEILGIPVEYSDPSARRMGNERLSVRRIEGQRLSRFVDCGSGITARPNADAYAVTLQVVTELRPGPGPGQTTVESWLTGSARPVETSGGTVGCTSKGTLEVRIAELLAGSGSLQ